MERSPRTELEVGGRTLLVSSLEKVLFPASGFRKRDLLDYYRAVAPVLVPHLAGRALQLGRWPDGVDGKGWFQSNCRGSPPWMRTHVVTGKRGQRLELCVIDEEAALVWAANQGTIELHAYQATIDAPDHPRAVVFDLDPGPGCDLRDCARAALAIRDAIAPRLGFVKTSGMKGLHVLVPINGGATFADAKAFSSTVARELAAAHAWLTDKMPRELRTNRVFIDCSQNDPGKQTVAPYSLRATPIPLVSTPLAWSELADPSRLPPIARIEPADVVARVARHGDLFADVLTLRQTL